MTPALPSYISPAIQLSRSTFPPHLYHLESAAQQQTASVLVAVDMAEEVNSSKASRLSTSSPTPGIRRAQTVGVGGDDTAQFRPRSAHKFSTGSNADSPSIGIRRRSSNFSDYSLNEARRQFQSSTDDLLLPKPGTGRDESFPASHWHSAPLAFALLPAVGGMLFKNGSSVVTDIMILGLAAIFLNWSVRLPW